VTSSDPLPPNPLEYDSPRAVRARAKERRYWKLLVIMVVTIVASGFVLGIVVALFGPAGGR
jgi:adenine/guanine phosphoribosyltransferase-like PRPP-binding protein